MDHSQYDSGIPIFQSLNRMEELMNKAASGELKNSNIKRATRLGGNKKGNSPSKGTPINVQTNPHLHN